MRIYLSRPHLGGTENDYIQQAIASNFVAPIGPQLNAFEEVVNAYLGGGLHCVALSSGSAALHLALRIAGVGTGDHVWISSMTFAGGIFPVVYQGAIPRFFDLDPLSWTLSVDLIEEELQKAAGANTLPKVIVPTDLYGQGVNLPRLQELCDHYGIALVMDSAESLGATGPDGQKCGSGGDMSILSFNGNKIITTSGGGMFVSKHKKYADEARFLATQARDPAPHYEHSTYGYNYRLSNICAAIGLGQMEVLDAHVQRRRAIFDRYVRALSRDGITFMPEPENQFSTRWLTALTFDANKLGLDRETVREKLLEFEIESRPLWKPMHMQPLFDGSSYVGPGLDEALFANGLCLPSGSDMTDDQQDEVIGHILDLLAA